MIPMPFTLIHKIKGFNIAEVWFAEKPYNIKGVSRASFYWCKENPDKLDGFEVSKGYYIFIDLGREIEEIKKEFEGTVIREINKAARFDFIVRFKHLDKEVIEYHNNFIKRLGLNFPDVSLVKDAPHITANIYLDSKLLVSQVYLKEGNMLWQLLAATCEDKNRQTSIAARYLTFKVIEYGKQNNFGLLSLSSIGNNLDHLDGIGKFKAGFSKNIKQGYVYTKYYNPLLKVLANKLGKNG